MDTKGTIGFTDEQAQLLEVAENFCRDKSPIKQVRALMQDDLGHDPALWQEVADLGWLAIAIPENYGGVGLSLAEVVPVVEQMGRRLLAGPFISTTLAAQALLAGGTEAQKAAILPEIAEGAAATLALCEDNADWDLANITAQGMPDGDDLLLSGTKTLVTDAVSAKWIIASVMLDNTAALVLLEAAKLPANVVRRETIIDETKRSYQLVLDGIRIPKSDLLDPARARETFEHIHQVGALLLAAEMCGGARAAIDYTVDYLQTRKQFGKIIGSYQALKHPIVDAHVAYEQARSHLYSAAYCFTQQGEGEVATRMAKAQAGEAFSFAADRAIQFHGGFGFTYDCDAQLYRRRSIMAENMYGDGIYHRRKLAALLL
jgi:alkylation response protein AidB-like acyl-CoA dehydrogenase